MLTVTAAGVRHRRHGLLRDLDVALEPGEIAAIVGPAGRARTTLLLTLAARFRLSASRPHTDAVLALGHVPGVYEPEPTLTVAEHLSERRQLIGRGGQAATDVERFGLDPGLRGWQLSAYQRQLLGLALAGLSGPGLLALDGLDDGLDLDEQVALRGILGALAAGGTAILVTARSVAVEWGWAVIRLGADTGPDPAIRTGRQPTCDNPSWPSPAGSPERAADPAGGF